ncbi:MAG: hypothetical protein H0V19_03535, partial [Euzebyales bacterium]|nr:hypothetical protein [Euzebyales bacterium]
MLRICLITLGSPDQLTGGYLYHRRLADLAPLHDACVDFLSLPPAPFPFPVLGTPRVRHHTREADVAVVDSIAAAFLAPLVAAAALAPPLVAILHQPPGGIDHGRLRTGLQASLDRITYRRCRLLLAASEALAVAIADVGPPVQVAAPGTDVAPPPREPPPDLRRGRATAIVTVGNWVARKGMVDLLDAVARLPDAAATLHLVGRTDADPRYGAT